LLQSPTGMISVLMEDSNDSNADFSSWKFRSVAHWGENPTGTWQVLVADLWANKVGTINHMKLRIMGYEEPNASVADWRLFE